MTGKDDGISREARKGQSIDHHPIEPNEGVCTESSTQEDSSRKAGSLPLETGNQYVHHKTEKE